LKEIVGDVSGNGLHRRGEAVLVDDLLLELPARQTRSSVVPSGFEPLDEALGGGLRTGTLTLLSGLPGVGKTILAMQWARRVAGGGAGAMYVCYEHDEATMLGRLLLSELGDLAAAEGSGSTRDIRALLWALANGEIELGEAAAGNLLVRAAHARVREYAKDMWLQAASGSRTGLDDIRAHLDAYGRERAVLFVDYLQKVPVAPSVAAVALKDMAVDFDVAVVAVVAGAEASLAHRRVRAQHLDSAAALTYEADTILIVNEKYAAVSKRHTAYDPVRAEGFKRQVVVSIEKNRSGPAGINLEFEKDFVHYRFHPKGGYVEESLIDDLIFTD
jgi:replicative DNA helicase